MPSSRVSQGSSPYPLKQRFWNASYFPALDGLRALSVLLVIAGHTRTALPAKYYLSGGLGVGIFFVLSGFLITTLLLREETAEGSVSLGAFYIRRFFRILPPYFLTLGIYLLVAMIPSQHELRTKVFNGLPYYLTLRNEYVPQGLAVAFTHSWSLSVEEKFYFVWPLLFFVAFRRTKTRWAALPITLLPLLISPSATLPVAYFSLLAGCCVAIALHALRSRQEAVLAFIDRIPVGIPFALWVLSYLCSLSGTFRVSFILTTAALLPFLLLKESWLSRILGSAACKWIGKRTYSMYLFHAFVLSAIEEHLIHPVSNIRYLAVVATVYGGTLGVAALAYVVLEKPSISWGRKLSREYTAARLRSSPGRFQEGSEASPEPALNV